MMRLITLRTARTGAREMSVVAGALKLLAYGKAYGRFRDLLMVAQTGLPSKYSKVMTMKTF